MINQGLKWRMLAGALCVAGVAGCNEIRKLAGVSREDDRVYAQSYSAEPGSYSQSYSYAYPAGTAQAAPTQQYQPYTPAQGYTPAYPAPAAQPASGEWLWTQAPGGSWARVFMPAGSSASPNPPLYGSPPQGQPVAMGQGRYETFRFADGHVEFSWQPNDPVTPAQGYWQVNGNQRTWIPGGLATASER